MALVREILRSNLKDLTVVSYGGADVGMLCAAGKVKKVVFAFVSLDFIPLEPYFRIARQTASIEVMEIDEGMMLLGLRAAAWGLPFIPTEVGLGTDIVTKKPGLFNKWNKKKLHITINEENFLVAAMEREKIDRYQKNC